MKVALLTNQFHVGGGLEHLYQLAKGMPDVSFFIFAQGGDAPSKLTTLPNVQTSNAGYHFQTLLDVNPDLIHIHHLKPLAKLSLHLSKLDVPVIYTVHGLHLRQYDFKKGFKSRCLRTTRKALEKYLLNRIQGVISVSKEDAEYIRKAYHVAGIHAIHNGVEKPPKEIPLDSIAQEMSLHKTSFVTIARFCYQKGYDILLAAIESIQEILRKKDVHFYLIGEGEDLQSIKNWVSSRKLQDLVTFTGKKTFIFPYLSCANGLIAPSRWEGLPLVLLEAGHCSLPVICSKSVGNREIVEDNIHGILCENESPQSLAKAILKAVENPESFQKMGERLHKRIQEDFSLEQMTQQTKDVYLSLLQAP